MSVTIKLHPSANRNFVDLIKERLFIFSPPNVYSDRNSFPFVTSEKVPYLSWTFSSRSPNKTRSSLSIKKSLYPLVTSSAWGVPLNSVPCFDVVNSLSNILQIKRASRLSQISATTLWLSTSMAKDEIIIQ